MFRVYIRYAYNKWVKPVMVFAGTMTTAKKRCNAAAPNTPRLYIHMVGDRSEEQNRRRRRWPDARRSPYYKRRRRQNNGSAEDRGAREVRRPRTLPQGLRRTMTTVCIPVQYARHTPLFRVRHIIFYSYCTLLFFPVKCARIPVHNNIYTI